VGGAMIELMGRPFRYNKKERKRLRRFAKKVATTAHKFETEGIQPNSVAVLRRLAESNIAIAKARKKKKSKNPKKDSTIGRGATRSTRHTENNLRHDH
jgi:hypothetical protein